MSSYLRVRGQRAALELLVVEVYRRSTNWQQEYYTVHQTIHLDQFDLELPLDAIYEGVF
ncbi:hypothetical protein KSF_029990 [Reticulibacter mediterranei]|uniref:Uncharacterized protein n=1 Tax=Reticulibacter mediterranei TaxID=2778369 RepID=A0A8J3IEP2_9CHLR|nr:hypothetical protein [Reticulibacter mediterranei]GHO92951.1 hypothetical protein KSF_029990 [Reticulibacter mediterranei]